MESYLVFFLIFGSILFAAIALFIIAYVRIARQRVVKHQMALEAIEAQKANELLQVKVRTHEQALQFVSWELHDNVCQVLGMSGTLLLDVVDIADEKRKDRLIEDIAQRLIATKKEVRDMATTLSRNKIEELGLIKFVEKEVAFVNSLHSHNIECTLTHRGGLPLLSSNQVLLIARIVQEAVMNIIKHAQAGHIHININSTSDKVVLAIEDDGIGFDQPEQVGEGMGLHNMQERAQLLGAELVVSSRKGSGSSITLILGTLK